MILASTLSDHLALLQTAGLITTTGDPVAPAAEQIFLFRHGLIQDAAYSSLLRRQQKAAHRAAGEVLEALLAERLASAEVAPQLGYHFLAAGDEARALRYFTQAGEAAARGYATAEAISHFTRSIELARRTAAPAATLVHLYSRLGRAYELSAAYPDALRVYEALAALSHERAEPALELESLIRRTTIYSTISPAFNPPQAHALAGPSLALARRLGNREAEARVEWNLLLVHLYSGQPEDAARHGQTALDLARALADQAPANTAYQELLAFVLTDAALAYIGVDQTHRAGAALAEARPLWRALGNLPMLAESVTRDAVYHMITGRLEAAAARYAEADDLCLASHNLEGQVVSQALAGIALISLGRLGPALAAMDRAISLAAATGNPIALAGSRAEAAWLYDLLGQPALALAAANLALRSARERFPLLVPWVLAVQAALHLRQGRLPEAAAVAAQLPPYQDYRRALSFMPPGWVRVGLITAEVHLSAGQLTLAQEAAAALLADLRRLEMAAAEADALLLLARIRLAQKQPAEAEALLRHADRLTLDQSNALTRWPVLGLLADLALARGAPAEAAALHAEARQRLHAMAASLPDPALRASFLATPAAHAERATQTSPFP